MKPSSISINVFALRWTSFQSILIDSVWAHAHTADECRMFRAVDNAFEFHCITLVRTHIYSDIQICVSRNIETITIMRATWAILCFSKGPLTSKRTHEHPVLRIKLNLTIVVSPNGKLVIFVDLRSLNPFWFIFSHHEIKKTHCRALAMCDERILIFCCMKCLLAEKKKGPRKCFLFLAQSQRNVSNNDLYLY